MTIARSLAQNSIVRKGGIIAALVAIVISPLYPLLRPNAYCVGDYVNSAWMVGYISGYLKLFHHPPNVFQTVESLGIAFPVFYGVLFYRVQGLIAILAGPNVAIHLIIFGGVFAEVGAVYCAARVLRSSVGVALLFCLGISCSTYQLTNLYNRGDLPEFFGFTLATTALACWFWSRTASGTREVWFCRAVLAAALTLMAGTHTITMVLGGAVFLGVSGLTLVVEQRRADVLTYGIALAAFGLGAAIPISEYLLVGHQIRFPVLVGDQMHFAGGSQFGFGMNPERFDSLPARFSLFPYDPATVSNGVQNVSTPYLEASIDYVLLAFAVATLLLRRDSLVATCVIAALSLAVLSVWPRFWTLMPGHVLFFQFTYRLTNYVNLLSLGAALIALRRLPDESRRIGRTPLPWVLATVAVIGCLVKLSHSAAFVHDEPGSRPISYYADVGPMAAAQINYTTTPSIGNLVPTHPVPQLIQMRSLGQPAPQSYTADRFGIIYTRILVLPWNKILIDGGTLPDALKIAWPDSPYYGIHERPGSRHVVDTYFVLPTIVDLSIRIAEYAFVLELGTIIGMSCALIVAMFQKRRIDSDRSMNAL